MGEGGGGFLPFPFRQDMKGEYSTSPLLIQGTQVQYRVQHRVSGFGTNIMINVIVTLLVPSANINWKNYLQ